MPSSEAITTRVPNRSGFPFQLCPFLYDLGQTTGSLEPSVCSSAKWVDFCLPPETAVALR